MEVHIFLEHRVVGLPQVLVQRKVLSDLLELAALAHSFDQLVVRGDDAGLVRVLDSLDVLAVADSHGALEHLEQRVEPSRAAWRGQPLVHSLEEHVIEAQDERPQVTVEVVDVEVLDDLEGRLVHQFQVVADLLHLAGGQFLQLGRVLH